jgi:hypothetical protein
MGGYVFMTVVVSLFLLSAIALWMSRQASVGVNITAAAHQRDLVRYSAEAGLAHSRNLLDKSNCAAYPIIPSSKLDNTGTVNYSVQLSSNSGSPVKITSTSTTLNGGKASLEQWTSVFSLPKLDYLPMIADTDIKSNTPDHNDGAGASLKLQSLLWENSVLLRFNLTALPTNVDIVKGLLKLKISGGVNGIAEEISLYAVNTAWGENTAKWTQADNSTPWLGGDTDTKAQTSVLHDPANEGRTVFDISDLLSQWLLGRPNHGIMLKLAPGSVDRTVFSREHPSQVPVLAVTHRCECGSVCAVISCNPHLLAVEVAQQIDTSATGLSTQEGAGIMPPGKSFMGSSAPEDGLIIIATNDGGPLIQFLDNKGSVLNRFKPGREQDLRGVTWVEGGTWQDHLAVLGGNGKHIFIYTSYEHKRVYYIDKWESLILPKDFIAEGIAHIGATPGGIYDHHWMLVGQHTTNTGNFQQVRIVDQGLNTLLTLDINSAITSGTGIAHLPQSNKFIVADSSTKRVVTFDFTGLELSQYSSTDYGTEELAGLAVNPYNCQHVLADKKIKQFLSLQQLSGCATKYQDNFDNPVYTGSNGSSDWGPSPWAERGEMDGPAAGDVHVLAIGALEISAANKGITRSVNLNPNLLHSLSFKRKRQDLDDGMDGLTLMISPATGEPWIDLLEFKGPDNDLNYVDEQIDISAYASATTQIGFRSSAGMGPDDVVLIDEVFIVSCPP